MKIKDGYIMREVAGSYVVVPTGVAALDFSGMITLNETAAFLWKQIEKHKTEQELMLALIAEYDIDKNTAKDDISEFYLKLKKADLFE